MNTNSNSYTIIYASVMVVIVAFLLAFVSSSLRATQNKNVELDTKKQILAALNIKNVEDADAEYNKYVKGKDLTSDFWLGNIEPEVEDKVKESKPLPTNLEEKPIVPIDRTQTVAPWLPQALRLAPSSLDPLAKEQVNLQRIEPVKLTTEPMLAEQERQRQTDVARVQATGLTPQQQEALLAQGLSSSQLASNDAIGKVEMANQQNQFQADQFNIGQTAKEDISNAEYRQDYQNKTLGSLNAYERDLRNFYNQDYLDRVNNFNTIYSIHYAIINLYMIKSNKNRNNI